MGKKRLAILGMVVGVLLGGSAIAWRAFNLPPVRLVCRYGFPPTGGVTGRHRTVAGLEFTEVAPGFRHIEIDVAPRRAQSWFTSLLDSVRPKLRRPRNTASWRVSGWVELPRPLWICEVRGAAEALADQYNAYAPSPVLWYQSLADSIAARLAEIAQCKIRVPTQLELIHACASGAARSADQTFQFCLEGDAVVLAPIGVQWKDAEGALRAFEMRLQSPECQLFLVWIR